MNHCQWRKHGVPGIEGPPLPVPAHKKGRLAWAEEHDFVQSAQLKRSIFDAHCGWRKFELRRVLLLARFGDSAIREWQVPEWVDLSAIKWPCAHSAAHPIFFYNRMCRPATLASLLSWRPCNWELLGSNVAWMYAKGHQFDTFEDPKEVFYE